MICHRYGQSNACLVFNEIFVIKPLCFHSYHAHIEKSLFLDALFASENVPEEQNVKSEDEFPVKMELFKIVLLLKKLRLKKFS